MWIYLLVGWGDLGSTIDCPSPDDGLAEEHEVVRLRDCAELSPGNDAGLLVRGEVLDHCDGAAFVRSDACASLLNSLTFLLPGSLWELSGEMFM